MKKMKSLLAVATIMMLAFTTLSAQNNASVIAVMNRADWCPACEKHGERAMTALMKANGDNLVRFVVNDVTDDETKESSALKLSETGLDAEKTASMKSTGVVYFFNAGTKELISSISMSKDDAVLVDAMKEAVNK
ncbi:MAG: hypothetical protein U5K32_03285 [Bacteroidales bacterium]|nr:hypothetical protein [Bacteroidales bacterium]